MNSRSWSPWLRKSGPGLRLGACFVAIAFAGGVIPLVEKSKSENNLLWVANGLLLAYLLLAPRWRWPAYLICGFLALSIRVLFLPASWQVILLYNLLNIVEVGTAALLLRPRSLELPRFTDRSYVVRFIAYGVLLGPVLAGALFALVLPFWPIDPQPHPFLNWAAADSLGIAISTPAFVAVFRTRLRKRLDWSREWFCPALLLVAAFAAFAQNTVPLIYVLYPLLTLVLVRLGLGYAALLTLFVAAIAGWFTINGFGPFANPDSSHPALPAVHLQMAIASAIFLIYTVSVVLENRRSIERRLEKVALLHALVTENSRDAIILADLSGHRSYISSAAQRMTGWSPAEFARFSSLELVHPDDLANAEARVRELRSGVEGAMIECRVRKNTGDYIWVEASLRIVHDPKTGAPAGILNIVRDATGRKAVEKKLQDAYHAVEALAATDPLTGLANRRRFDQVLIGEWRRGLRNGQPLSLLMIDADLFKLYNDAYGHPRGDNCLKQVAEAARDVVSRPGDLVARFGGEEFAVVLPNTDIVGALQLGTEICEAMRARRLPHSGNPVGIVTVSVGCATMMPAFGRHAANLIERADQALYKAKERGRNQVCDATALKDGRGESRAGELAAIGIGIGKSA